MRLTTYLLASVALGIPALSSCSSEIDMPDSASMQNENAAHDDKGIEAALRTADNFFSEIGEGTRATQRKVESVLPLYGNKTRAGEEAKPGIYLINYADNKGFAMVGASGNSDVIYAISEKGHLEPSDTLANPTLAAFFRGAEEHAALAAGDFGPVYPSDYVYVVTNQVVPMLNSNVGVWHEEAPFNKYSPVSNGVSAPVGNGVLALSSLLSYYEKDAPYPYAYSGREGNVNIDWSIINDITDESSAKVDQLALYFKILGNNKFLRAF